MEDNLTTSCTRRSRKTLGDGLCLTESQLVEYGVQEFVELLRLATKNSSLLVNHAFMEEVHSNLDHSCTCALTVTSLQEPELAFLNGELHILHVVIVLLELVLQSIQLLVKLRHSLFH